MCCLPVGCVKGTLSFFAGLTILAGLVASGFAIYELADKASHIGWSNPTTIAAGLYLGFGLLCVLVGVFGVVGAQKKSRCCLCIYQFSVFPMVLISLLLAFFSTFTIVIAKDMKDTDNKLDFCEYTDQYCDGCGNDGALQWVKDTNANVWTATTQIFGKSDSCIIYASNQQQLTYYQSQGYQASMDLKAPGVVKSVLDCNISNQVKDDANFMSFFEENFDCSGFCAATPFYAFYDSSQPIDFARPSCYEKIQGFFDNLALTLVAWFVFLFYLLNMILSCCLCCHPDRNKDKEGGDIYARMNYYDTNNTTQ